MAISTHRPSLVIGVMGVTGSGKSSFVQTASGSDKIVVGHGLEACTQEVTAYQFTENGYSIFLVDTPGFNDTYKSDTEILQDLSRWLESTYRQKTQLSGIIYLHRISDVRMDGGAMRNLKMFRKLCGEKPMENVIIASTFWGSTDEDIATAHEKELMEKPEFWGEMIEHGAQIQRFTGSRESALQIIMSFASKAGVTLDIQRELVDEEKRLDETAAGTAVSEELRQLEKKYQKELEKMQQEMSEALAEKDVQYERMLRKQKERMEKKMERIHQDQELLRRERREEMRRIELENKIKLSQWQRDHSERLERQRGEFRGWNAGSNCDRCHSEMRGIHSDFCPLIREVRSRGEDHPRESLSGVEGESIRVTEEARRQLGGTLGVKFLNLIAAGMFAAFDPAAIPVAIAALTELMKEV